MAISRAAFIIAEVVFLTVAHGLGGPPWTLIGVLAFLALSFERDRAATVGLLAPSLLWLVLFRATGNRELFFPFTMHLASVVACRVAGNAPARGLLAGGLVVAAFLAIRVWQRATLPVLGVEAAVAAAILVGAVFVRARSPRRPIVDAAIVAASALLACAGLLL